MRYILIGLATTALATILSAQNGLAQTAENEISEARLNEKDKKPRAKKADEDVFVLGRINVYGDRQIGGTSGQAVSQSVVSAEDIRGQNRNTLDDALRTVPGVESSNFGGQRNERMVYIRGFDRWQAPLSIDGVRIYLPADNRLDYGRFLTPDLAEIQIHKGYVSVLDGPGGMGGAINLVTRKPTRELEGEVRAGFDLGNTGDMAGYTLSGSVGTKQEMFYLQASGAIRDSDGWFLSRNYEPSYFGGTPTQESGKRDFSDVNDWRGNVKFGFTPNETDEYVISYTRQEGSKGAPYNVRQALGSQQNWKWPEWDIASTSFNSHTQVGDDSYVKTKVYYNTFDNLLAMYDDSTFTSQAGSGENSYYNDYAYGFSMEGGTELIPMNTLKAALHFRKDVHRRWNHRNPGAAGTPDISPLQRRIEDTWSIAAENTFHATDTIDLVGGVSYDWYDTKRAENFDGSTLGEYPLFSNHALNWQTAAIWRPNAETEFHASISSRTRFPNLFERYSTRFNTNLPNPDLGPERATNYEIGGTGAILDGRARIGGAIFYSDVGDAIQSVRIATPPGETGQFSQFQNIGKATYYGFEVSGEWDVLPELTLGGNYTYLKSKYEDPGRPDLKPVGRPEHVAYLYAHWTPVEALTVTPSIELSSHRWSTNNRELAFFRVPGFGLANINAEYRFNEQTSFTAGVRNI
ncbi:TonB-dependent receptor plug domain-containing protein [Aquamicrobium ahrensii]|uniref:Iron complex outermembrane receptor protein n=1 Tax=Aquamicrobium ahrensii TaxID=469551 RepID=A0ABV2KNK5_9HYPH